MNPEPDVIVVGAGAGGGVAAWALVRLGVHVLLLETGPRFDPALYPTHRQDWQIAPDPFTAVSDDAARRSYDSGPGEPLDPDFAYLASRSETAFARSSGARREPFRYSRALGVGGSTLHYQGEAHRFPAHAFRMASERGVAVDWPIGYEDLAPYYDRVERLLGVAGDPGNPFKPARGPFPYPAHPLSEASLRVGAGARELGWRQLPNSLGVLPAARPGRSPCHYCNGCTRGCRVGAKASVDVAVIPEAERTGRLRIATGIHVSRLEVADDGRVRGVIAYDETGSQRRYRARAVVLATGAIETPRILLSSVGRAHPHGVGNADDQVGRNLMEFLYLSRFVLFERSLQSYAGLPLDSRIWDFNGAARAGRVANGFVLGQVCGLFEGPLGYALEGVPGFGAEHREGMARSFGAGLELMGIAEQLPRPENRVRLSEHADRFSMPLARVETRLDAADLAVLSEMWEKLGDLAEAARVDRIVGQFSAYDRSDATHVGGTCRMGTAPETSVVDRFGAVHGHPNLVIADASVLVTQGAGDSPSLTLQALALRAAEALARRATRGELLSGPARARS